MVYNIDNELIRVFSTNCITGANEHNACALVKQYQVTAKDENDYVSELTPAFERVMRCSVTYFKVNKKPPTANWLHDKTEEIFSEYE